MLLLPFFLCRAFGRRRGSALGSVCERASRQNSMPSFSTSIGTHGGSLIISTFQSGYRSGIFANISSNVGAHKSSMVTRLESSTMLSASQRVSKSIIVFGESIGCKAKRPLPMILASAKRRLADSKKLLILVLQVCDGLRGVRLLPSTFTIGNDAKVPQHKCFLIRSPLLVESLSGKIPALGWRAAWLR